MKPTDCDRRTVRIGFVLVILYVTCSTSGAAQQSKNGVRPLASVKELHDLVITPASDAVFRAGGEAPTTSQGWTAARNQALMLAEAGNLLMIGTRARDTTRWITLSRALVDAAAMAATAAEKKDAKALAGAGDGITAACEACHRPYRDGGRQMGTPR